MRRTLLITNGVICIAGALNAALTMFTTFAPTNPSEGWMAGESETIERVRTYFWPDVNIAACLLLACGLWMFVSAGRSSTANGTENAKD